MKLGVQFKLQSGLGDEDIVDEKTADALNALLKRFGAFGFSTDFVVHGTVKDAHNRPKPASSSSPSTGICAVGRNRGTPRPTQRTGSRSRIDTSPFVKRRAWSRPFDCRPAAPQLRSLATQRGRFCFLLQTSLCGGPSVVIEQQAAELLKAGCESFAGRMTCMASSPSVG